jgi:hypothetical protein
VVNYAAQSRSSRDRLAALLRSQRRGSCRSPSTCRIFGIFFQSLCDAMVASAWASAKRIDAPAPGATTASCREGGVPVNVPRLAAAEKIRRECRAFPDWHVLARWV